MGRIVVFELPENIGSREAWKHLKELDDRIDMRISMSFDNWARIVENEGLADPIPHPFYRGRLKVMSEHIREQMTTPMEKK